MNDFQTLRLVQDEGVLTVFVDAPPINLLGPDLVRDLAAFLAELETQGEVRVVVFESADTEYFVPHEDFTRVDESSLEAGTPGNAEDASLGMLFRRLSLVRPVTIAKIRNRARGAGSELALACDMRFISRERGIMAQPEIGLGLPPGAGGIQHLARLVGRGRAMEVILGASDFDAALAERYGWVNRSLPDDELDAFVSRLARRIASFPAISVEQTKEALNALTLATDDAVRSDAHRYRVRLRSRDVQDRLAVLFAEGLQTRSVLEHDLGAALEDL